MACFSRISTIWPNTQILVSATAWLRVVAVPPPPTYRMALRSKQPLLRHLMELEPPANRRFNTQLTPFITWPVLRSYPLYGPHSGLCHTAGLRVGTVPPKPTYRMALRSKQPLLSHLMELEPAANRRFNTQLTPFITWPVFRSYPLYGPHSGRCHTAGLRVGTVPPKPTYRIALRWKQPLLRHLTELDPPANRRFNTQLTPFITWRVFRAYPLYGQIPKHWFLPTLGCGSWPCPRPAPIGWH